MAVCGETRSFLGFKTRYVGYLLFNGNIVGRYLVGQRTKEGWVPE